MNSSAPDRLTDILDGLQARLEGELRGNRVAVTHPGARGEASEEDWLRVLKDHLPHRYQADRAFVIDSLGDCSEQIDVVIYDHGTLVETDCAEAETEDGALAPSNNSSCSIRASISGSASMTVSTTRGSNWVPLPARRNSIAFSRVMAVR